MPRASIPGQALGELAGGRWSSRQGEGDLFLAVKVEREDSELIHGSEAAPAAPGAGPALLARGARAFLGAHPSEAHRDVVVPIRECCGLLAVVGPIAAPAAARVV